MPNTMKFGDTVVALLNEYDVTGALNQSDIADARTVVDARTYAGNDKVASPNHAPTLSHSGFNVYGTNKIDAVTFARMITNADNAGAVVFGGIAGSDVYEVLGKLDQRSVPVQVEQIHGIQYGINGHHWIRGRALHCRETISSSGAKTGVELLSAIGASEVLGVIWRITDATGLTSIAAKIQHSSDSTNGTNGTWADVTGVNFTASAIGWGLLTANGALGPWFRLNVTALTGSCKLSVNAGRYL